MNDLNYRDEAIRRLAESYKDQFAEVVAEDERFHDIIMEISEKFVEDNLPIVQEDDATDLAMELFMRITTRAV